MHSWFEGLGLASQVVDTPLGLATASLYRLVSVYSSGVLVPPQAKQLAYSSLTNKNMATKVVIFLVRLEGLEPPTFWFEARRSIQLS